MSLEDASNSEFDNLDLKLRHMEIDAYSKLISVFRARGYLTEERKKLLKQIGTFLNIPIERHRAEARRVSCNTCLKSIAEKLTGDDWTLDWYQEGKRGIPIPCRSNYMKAATPLADFVANTIASRGAEFVRNTNERLGRKFNTQETIPVPSSSKENKAAVKEKRTITENEISGLLKAASLSDASAQTDPVKKPSRGCTYCKRRKEMRKKKLAALKSQGTTENEVGKTEVESEVKGEKDETMNASNSTSEDVQKMQKDNVDEPGTGDYKDAVITLPSGTRILIENTVADTGEDELDLFSATIIAQEVEIESEPYKIFHSKKADEVEEEEQEELDTVEEELSNVDQDSSSEEIKSEKPPEPSTSSSSSTHNDPNSIDPLLQNLYLSIIEDEKKVRTPRILTSGHNKRVKRQNVLLKSPTSQLEKSSSTDRKKFKGSEESILDESIWSGTWASRTDMLTSSKSGGCISSKEMDIRGRDKLNVLNSACSIQNEVVDSPKEMNRTANIRSDDTEEMNMKDSSDPYVLIEEHDVHFPMHSLVKKSSSSIGTLKQEAVYPYKGGCMDRGHLSSSMHTPLSSHQTSSFSDKKLKTYPPMNRNEHQRKLSSSHCVTPEGSIDTLSPQITKMQDNTNVRDPFENSNYSVGKSSSMSVNSQFGISPSSQAALTVPHADIASTSSSSSSSCSSSISAMNHLNSRLHQIGKSSCEAISYFSLADCKDKFILVHKKSVPSGSTFVKRSVTPEQHPLPRTIKPSTASVQKLPSYISSSVVKQISRTQCSDISSSAPPISSSLLDNSAGPSLKRTENFNQSSTRTDRDDSPSVLLDSGQLRELGIIDQEVTIAASNSPTSDSDVDIVLEAAASGDSEFYSSDPYFSIPQSYKLSSEQQTFHVSSLNQSSNPGKPHLV